MKRKENSMAMTNSSLYFLGFFLCLFACSSCAIQPGQKQDQRWCVAQGSAPDDKLQAFLDSCCSELNCAEIQAGGSCYEPNTLKNHASYALDLYFRNKGECNSELGTPSVTDPSFGNCHYP